MNENEYGTPDFSITTEPDTSYVHPVLTQLNDKIATLEQKVATLTESESNQRNRYYEVYSNFSNYKNKLENVLRTFAQEDEDNVELCVMIADEMDIELTNTKDFTVNVSFSITVSAPFGEEIELSEWDVDASLDLGGIDFELNSTDVVYVNED